jgi:hypothetical protein
MALYRDCALIEVLRTEWRFEDREGGRLAVDRDARYAEMEVGSRADLEWNDKEAVCRIVQVTKMLSSTQHLEQPPISFSPCRYSLSPAYFAANSLTPEEISRVELISTLCPTIRKLNQRGGFWAAIGLACIETQPEQIREFRDEIERAPELRKLTQELGTAQVKWFEKQWNSQEFYSAVMSFFQRLFLSRCSSIGLVQDAPSEVIKPRYVLDDAVFHTMAQILRVKLVIYMLAERELKRTYRGNGAQSSPSLYLLVSHGHVLHILYPSVKDSLPVPVLQPSVKGEMLQTVSAIWHLTEGMQKTTQKWQLLGTGADVIDKELLTRFELSVKGLEYQEKTGCVSCGIPSADIKLSCHSICSQCLDNTLAQQFSQPPYQPYCPCSAPLSSITIRQLIGSKRYQQLQINMPDELKDYECEKCLRCGNYKEIYKLACDCCLCIYCAAESIRNSRKCPCSLPLPEEIQLYCKDFCLICSRCHVSKPILSCLAHSPCHPLCKACAATLLREPETACCPQCDRLYTQREQTQLAESLQGFCLICHMKKPFAEMVEMECACEICEECMSRSLESTALTMCPKCRKVASLPALLEKQLWRLRGK